MATELRKCRPNLLPSRQQNSMLKRNCPRVNNPRSQVLFSQAPAPPYLGWWGREYTSRTRMRVHQAREGQHMALLLKKIYSVYGPRRCLRPGIPPFSANGTPIGNGVMLTAVNCIFTCKPHSETLLCSVLRNPIGLVGLINLVGIFCCSFPEILAFHLPSNSNIASLNPFCEGNLELITLLREGVKSDTIKKPWFIQAKLYIWGRWTSSMKISDSESQSRFQ